MNTPYAGACLCGAVKFTIAAEFESFYLCHCEYCRKDTGSAHAANLFASHARITWLCGRDQVKTFRLPGTRHARAFCADCGSALPLQDGPLLVVPAGCLDGEVGMRPQAHLFSASRADWDQALESLPTFATFPL